MRWRWQPAAERRSEVITQLLLLVLVLLLAVFCSIITDTCAVLTRITFNHHAGVLFRCQYKQRLAGLRAIPSAGELVCLLA